MSHAVAIATLISAFPDLTLVEVVHHERDAMTDTAPEQTEDWSDVEQDADGVTFPEYPSNPHNHRFTVSFDPNKPPFVVVRASTAAELKAAFGELETSGAYAAMGAAYDALKRQGAVGAGIPAPGPQGPPMPPQMQPQGPPFGPNVSVPGAPAYAGPPALPVPPAPPQTSPEYQQHGWYKLTVPWSKKDEMAAIVAQYQLRKGRPSEGGKVSWNKADKSWYVAPDAAGAFPQFSPVPA